MRSSGCFAKGTPEGELGVRVGLDDVKAFREGSVGWAAGHGCSEMEGKRVTVRLITVLCQEDGDWEGRRETRIDPRAERANAGSDVSRHHIAPGKFAAKRIADGPAMIGLATFLGPLARPRPLCLVLARGSDHRPRLCPRPERLVDHMHRTRGIASGE